MEQDERLVLGPSEGSTEQNDAAPDPATSAVLAGAEDHERVSEVDTFVPGAGPESSKKKQDVEEPSPESDEVTNEDRELFENPAAIATHFEFRSAGADMAPPSESVRARSRGGKQAGLMRFTAAGGDGQDVSEAAVLGASSSSAPATCAHEGVPAMADGDQGTAPEDDKKLKRACSAPGARVAIAHASPRDSYRRVPWRSRKQYSPKRFVTAVGASPSAAATPAGDPTAPATSPGSTLPSWSASGLRTEIYGLIDATASTGITDIPSSSSSKRPPSRGRKQPRPEHFIPEEAEATASAKARRSGIVLDRFLSSQVHGSPVSDSEWVRNVTAEEDAAIHAESGVEGFRIRDASRASGLRVTIGRLGASCGGECASSSPSPGEPDGRGRFYGVLAVLGAAVALAVVSCVLFYIVGQRSEAGPGPSAEMPDE